MEQPGLEPGILRIFRLYIMMRLGVILSSAIVFLLWYRSLLQVSLVPYVVLFVVDLSFLFGVLGWPWVQRRMGRAFLPIALAIATVVPIVEAPYLSELYGGQSMPEFWLVFPFLLIPLILTAWQYSFRTVIVFTAGTWLLEIILLSSQPFLVPTDVPIRINLLMVRSFLFLLIGYIVSNLVSAQRAQRRQLAAANRKLVRYAVALEQLTVSRERNRLARELHDTLAHTLSGLAVQLEAIMTIWEGLPRRAEAMLERALSMTRKGLQETRRALQDLRAAPLEDVGLALAIRGLAEGLAARYGFELTLAIDEHLSDLAPEVEQCYYRVAQEALENAARHANASTVSLTLARNGDRVLLKVVDDGAGFEAADAEEGLGIKGMVERAELIGGELHVETQPGQGTTVRLASDARP